MKKFIIIPLLFIAITASSQQLPMLKISDNGHYLQQADGTPFFYQGDTAWELFHRLDREEAEMYLKNRAAKGYNVIQAVALAELDGIGTPNAYGHLPLIDRNPARPAVKEGEQNDYWDHVDYIVKRCNELGMYMGLLPTWGQWWMNDVIFNKQNAEEYGRWIAERYKDCNIIWILGGDRNPSKKEHQDVIRAMARGIRSVDKTSLITVHPSGRFNISQYFHHDTWLDFNSRQSGHVHNYKVNQAIYDNYNLTPAKPILEIEPLYEDHPLDFKPDEYGHSISWDVRRAMYWSVFYGSAGITYGHHSVWQMFDKQKGHSPKNRPLMAWHEALDQPAAGQTIYLRRLIESRPFFSRTPAPDFIVTDEIKSSVPGAGRYRFVATMDADGSYAMVYAPIGRTFSVKGSMLKAKTLTAWWYCPRTGKAEKIGTIENSDRLTFTPPMPGEATDWVLVLDDATKRYPAPGKTKRR